MLKIIVKIAVILMIIVLLCYILLSGLVFFGGKNMLSGQIEKLTGRQASIGSVFLSPYFSLVIRDLRVENLLSAGSAEVQPSLIGFLIGKPGLNKLLLRDPYIEARRINQQEFDFTPILSKLQAGDKKGFFFIKYASINNARLNFVDDFMGTSLGFGQADIEVSTNVFNFRTDFSLEANVVSGDNRPIGSLDFKGWLNWPKKDMRSDFSLKGLEMKYFDPYLRGRIGKKIESGQVSFVSELAADNNDLKVGCRLEFGEFLFGDQASLFDFGDRTGALWSVPLVIIANSIIGSGNSGVFEFSILTKLDDPKFEGIQFKGSIFPNIIQESFTITPEMSREVIRGIKNDFRHIDRKIDGQFKDVVNELRSKVLKEEVRAEVVAGEFMETEPEEEGEDQQAPPGN